MILDLSTPGDMISLHAQPKYAGFSMSDSRQLSHIWFEGLGQEAPPEIREYFRAKGVPIVEESVSSDELGRQWLVLSVPVSDVTPLVLELLEKGLGGDVQGINAQTRI